MPPSQRGTGFTNLQTYLGLNHGAAQRMGNELADSNASALDKAGADMTADADAQRAAIQSGTLRADLNPNSFSEGQRLARSGYTGPENPELRAGEHLAAASNAYNRTMATGSNEGRSTLLREKYGQNTWGGGALDAALAGAGGAAQRLDSQRNTAQGAFSRLRDSLGTAQADLTSRASAARTASTAAAQGYQDTVNRWEQQGMSNTPAEEQAPGIRNRRREDAGERTNRGGFGRNYP